MEAASPDAAVPSSRPDDGASSSIPGLTMLVKLLCVTVIVAVMMGVAVPQYLRVERLGYRTRALAQARGIGLVLKVYASDHEGFYPAGENVYGQKLLTANDAFRGLIPEYVQSEVIFGNEKSAWQTGPADNRILPASEILRSGENVYDYVMGLNDLMHPSQPLVADGTDGSGLGTYVSNPRVRGGVWAGEQAIVIRLDQSGHLEHLAGPPEVRSIVQLYSDGTRRNLLSPAGLGKGVKLLEPAMPVPEVKAKARS